MTKTMTEAAPPGPWGEWTRYMIVHHPNVKPGIIYGIAWKNHKANKKPPILSKKPPTYKEVNAALKRNRTPKKSKTKREKQRRPAGV